MNSARAKNTITAIKRTVFSLCVFELEDSILTVIDTSLKSDGWTVASLQYDGCHVQHRAGGNLAAAMRRAEAAVRERLGYVIQLKEKPLFEAGDESADLLRENDALMDNEEDE